MIDIFDYFDYRDYLRAFYEYKKGLNSWYSYRYMGGKVNTDPSQLVKILQGKRHIAQNTIPHFTPLCGFNEKEALYFDTLVRFSKSRSDVDSKKFYEELIALRGVNRVILSDDQFEFYHRWYHAAILNLLCFYPFDGDFEMLGRKLSPRITAFEAEASVLLLLRLGLLGKKDDGGYFLTNTIISCGDNNKNLLVRAYQNEMIRLAGESLDRHKKDIRNISTVCITIDTRDLDKINEMVTQFRHSLLKLAEETPHPNSVYQLNIQLFPLTDGALSGIGEEGQ